VPAVCQVSACNSSRALHPAASLDSFFRLYSSRTMGWRSAQCRRLAALLLLINRYVPLALTILRPVIVNILLYQLLLHHEGNRGRADRDGVLVCVVLPLSPVLFRDLLPQRLRLRRDSERLRVCADLRR